MDRSIQRSWLSSAFDVLGVEESARRSFVRVLGLALASRLVLCLAIYLAVKLGRASAHPLTRTYDITNPILIGLLRWDVPWYVSVLERGIQFDPHEASNAAFLPGFPAASALADLFVRNHLLSTVVAANVAFFAAVVAFWGWIRERQGLQVAERAILWLLVYPFSFFFNTGYSESLFFLLCTLALRDADRGSWSSAGIFASLATLTRPFGIFLVPAFAVGLVAKEGRGALVRAAPAVLMPVAALGLYAVYLWLAFGTPFAVIRAQEIGWHVGHGWNVPRWHPTRQAIQGVVMLVHLLLPLALGALSFLSWRKLGVAAGIYAAIVSIAVILNAGDSIGREALSIVPVFAAGGAASLGGSALMGLGFLAFALLVTFTCGFAVGQFMG